MNLGASKPNATVAENREAGDSWVLPDYMDATRKYGAGLPTAVVNQMLESAAAIDNLPVTWNWHHLNHKLGAGGAVGASDITGLTQWLSWRHLAKGLHAEYTTYSMGCLDKIFNEVEGAREHLEHAKGARVSFYDTTHSTNEYDLKLGCVTGVDVNGKTVLLAVSLLTREDAKSFAWAFKMFQAAMHCHPDVSSPTAIPPWPPHFARGSRRLRICCVCFTSDLTSGHTPTGCSRRVSLR